MAATPDKSSPEKAPASAPAEPPVPAQSAAEPALPPEQSAAAAADGAPAAKKEPSAEKEPSANKKPPAQDKKPAAEHKTSTPDNSDAPAKASESSAEANKPAADTDQPEPANRPSAATNNEPLADQHQPASAADGTKPHTAPAKAAEQPLPTVAELEASLARLSAKNTGALRRLDQQLSALAANTAATESGGADSSLASLRTRVDELLAGNATYQQQLQSATMTLLAELKTELEAGQSEKALPTWDRIQGNISNTSGKLKSTLQQEAGKYKAEVLKLRDWKMFAATEKKQELIKQMQALADSDTQPAQRNKQINSLHKHWQSLGRSRDNESLWKQFKTLSDKAYEPCKAYFRERKQAMAENLKKRRELCATLETTLAEVEAEAVDVVAIGKLIKKADEDWKRHAPVEQSKIKNLQKRYYALVNKLRKLRKHTIREHVSAKQELVNQAQALTEAEDNKQAMEAAKQLQQQWQQVGPTTFKDDKKLWADFRAACDQIFGKQRQQASETRASLDAAEKKLQQLLAELEKILALDDAGLRESRTRYQSLLQEFNAALDPRLRKSRSRYMDRFNELKRRGQARIQALPDKKQQALSDNINAHLALLDDLEARLLASADAGQYKKELEGFDLAAWQALGDSGNAELDKLLNSRLEILQKANSPADLADAISAATAQLRDLCIDLEIRADTETPTDDQGRRMELQLAQLQQAFGQHKPDRRANARHALEVELQARCLGPLPPAQRESFLKRLRSSVQKLR